MHEGLAVCDGGGSRTIGASLKPARWLALQEPRLTQLTTLQIGFGRGATESGYFAVRCKVFASESRILALVGLRL